MRVLILGKNGMLGSDMQKVFHDTDFVALGREEFDITGGERVMGQLMSIAPDIVINCTGYTRVDDAEENEEEASKINGYAISLLAEACREIDATLVHFSTDYVFKGDRKNGYGEEDSLDPINAYGRSKALGEKLLIEEMEYLDRLHPVEGKYFLIRTSWLFGRHGKNFVDTMLQLAESKKEVRVVNDQYGSPTFSMDLCKQVRWLVQSHEYPSGIYHMTNSGVTTWYEFARKIFELSGKKVSVLPCSSASFPRPAKRPQYSALANNKLPALRPWEEALKEYLTS